MQATPMKRAVVRMLTTTIAVILGGGAGFAQSSNAAGRWDVLFTTPEGEVPAIMILKKDGEKLSGTISGQAQEVMLEGTQKDAAVTIWFSINRQDGPMAVTMTGTQEGNSLRGSADYGGSAQGEWAAKRAAEEPAPAAPTPDRSQPVDVSGPWALEVNTGAGGGTPSVTFKQDGEKLTGQYSGQLGEAPLTGTLKGHEITWTFDITVEGASVRVVFTGTVERDAMRGSVTFGELGEGTFTGKRK